MRNDVFPYLYELMSEFPDIVCLTGDLGYLGFDKIRDDYPDRFINTGASEQSMLDIAVGLAMQGKIPICYSITPFLIFRAFETIRNYINNEKIPVILLGSGRNDEYHIDGFSHYCGDDRDFIEHFENIRCFWPNTTEYMKYDLRNAIVERYPAYINLTKEKV